MNPVLNGDLSFVLKNPSWMRLCGDAGLDDSFDPD